MSSSAQDPDDIASVSRDDKPKFSGRMYGKLLKQIHISHKKGQSIRNVLLPVLLTSERNYATALVQFYLPTRMLEDILRKHRDDPLVAAILQLETSFAPGYAADLQHLLGEQWEQTVATLEKPAAAEYCGRLRRANEENDIITLVAAYFILHGPLVVGGGPALKPFVEKAFGIKAVHVLDIKNRDEAKASFKNFFNKLELQPAQEAQLLEKCGSFMELNNELLTQLDLMPTTLSFWLPTIAVGLALTATAAYVMRSSSGSLTGRTTSS